MKSTIFAFLSFVGTIVVVVLFNHITGWELNSFSLWFIIPVGGLLVGAAAASGLFYGYLKDNKPVGAREYIIGILIGLTAFYGINYVSYLTTYVDQNNEINYSFKGDPISSYEIDGEPITFGKYLDISKTSQQSIYFHGSTTDINTGKTGTSLINILQVLASGLAGLGIGLIIVGNRRYCENCKKYTIEKVLSKFDVEHYEEVMKSLVESSNDPTTLKRIITETKLTEEKVNTYAQTEIDYCPDCYDSRLVVKVFQMNSKKEFEELTKFKQVIQISVNTSRAIVIDLK